MEVLKKPPNWNQFVFTEKLKWYAKKSNDAKNIFSDKFKIKQILKEMNLIGLHYTKIITYVKPLEPLTDLNIVVPVDQLLKEEKYRFNKEKVDAIFKTTETTNEFWETVKDKYDIERYDTEKKPPDSYVIKLNLGWNTMIFVCKERITRIVCGTQTFPLEYRFFYFWKKYVLKQYTKKIQPKLFIEEFIGYGLKVYEVYCIYGKPRILSLYYETELSYENNYLVNLEETVAEETVAEETVAEVDENQKTYSYSQTLINGSHLIKHALPLDFIVDEDTCKQVCIFAQEFAKYFEFIRVDFYLFKNKVYFSECTFKPGALKKIQWFSIGTFLNKFWSRVPEL